MLLCLCLGVILLGRVTAFSGEESSAAAGIVAGLAAACSDGVRNAVDQEIWNAHNHSVQTSSGQQRTAQQIMSSLQQMLQNTRLLAPEDCPAGWKRHEDSCFLIPPQKATWYLAHHACAVMDPRARLASVHPASSKFIEAMVASFDAEKAVWVGLARLDGNAGWVWSDASPFDYANWDRTQPNGGNQICVHLGWPNYPNNRFHDNVCSTLINMLCQINLK